MRRRLLATIAVVAMALGACDDGEAPAEDLASVDQRADDADTGEPTQAATTAPARPAPTFTGPPMQPLAEIEVEVDELPTGPGLHLAELVTVEVSGRRTTRTFQYHVPEGEGPFPLMLVVHPFGQSGDRFERGTGLGRRGAERGAVVVLPDATGVSWNASLTCCQPAISEERPDAAFLVALVELFQERLPIGEVSATGFSNGGFMSYRLACVRADLFQRIAVVAGTMEQPCHPSESVAVLHLHGDEDAIIPMVDDRAPFSPQTEGRSARRVTDFWAELAGCEVPETTEDDLDESIVYEGCEDEDALVSFEVLRGVGHEWPEGTTDVVLRWLLGVA